LGLIEFAIEIIIAYFVGQVLAFVFIIFAGIFIAVGAGICYAFQWIMAHLAEISAVIGLIAAIVYLLIFIQRKRVITRA